MLSIFSEEGYSNIATRLQALTPGATRGWGQMTVAQMLAHCNRSLEYRLGKFTLPVSPQRVDVAAKAILFNDTPYAQNAPTGQAFIITDQPDFDTEKNRLAQNLQAIVALGEFHPWPPHVTFGPLTGEEQGKSIFKHLDHHLRQFGG